jgi:F-type H+-transporting ATPase subunit delta
MERATLARPYAEAIAKLAASGNAWAAWSDHLAMLNGVMADAQMQTVISNPAVDGKRVADLVISVCGAALPAEGGNLVQLLAENKRLGLVDEISAQFELIKAQQEGELTAHITSAFPLTAEQMAGLVAKLEAKFARKVNATQSTNAELIGGVVVQVGDEVMDASVRGGLEALSVTLKA